MAICHTIILSIDWFIDLNLIRDIMKADLYSLEKENYRKVNLGK